MFEDEKSIVSINTQKQLLDQENHDFFFSLIK